VNEFNEILIDAIKRDSETESFNKFVFREVCIKHLDRSEYKITHSRIERSKTSTGLKVLIVFAEHNTPNVFAESDLESVVTVDWKGKKKEIKLQNM
jgi:hypothetical protein